MQEKEKGIIDLEVRVTEYMLKLGIPAHIKGYYYLRSAIVMTIKDPKVLSAVTKILYPALAKEYKSTMTRCERAIRHAIDIAWKRGDREFIRKVFSFTVNQDKGRPTNSEFIAIISDRIRLDNEMQKEYETRESA